VWEAIGTSLQKAHRRNRGADPFTFARGRDSLSIPLKVPTDATTTPTTKERTMKTVLSLLFGFAIASQVQAQTAQQAQHLPRGTAVDITNAEILTTAQKTAAAPVSDQQIRVVSINGEYNVGVGVVHRAKTEGRDIGFGIEHSQITEIYHVISGNGTFVTGGTIENMRETPAESPVVTTLNGPSSGGGKVIGGQSRKIGPGDVVIIPPNTPHWFTEITSDQIVYLVVRVDPRKVLPAGYGAK
jgi:mannose-6-phosphate isomerase-like protein (cupin superfamily)